MTPPRDEVCGIIALNSSLKKVEISTLSHFTLTVDHLSNILSGKGKEFTLIVSPMNLKEDEARYLAQKFPNYDI